MSLPKVVRVQQNFDATHITDIPKTVSEQIGKLGLHGRLKPDRPWRLPVAAAAWLTSPSFFVR